MSASTLIYRCGRRRREQCTNDSSGSWLLSSSCGMVYNLLQWIFGFLSKMEFFSDTWSDVTYTIAPVLLGLPAGSSWCNSGDFLLQDYKISSWQRFYLRHRGMVQLGNWSSSHGAIHEKIILPRTGNVEASRNKFRSIPKAVSSAL